MGVIVKGSSLVASVNKVTTRVLGIPTIGFQ